MAVIPMKRMLVVLAVLGLAASLSAQSLVELAKREKERREALKGRHAAVVTNRDLLLVKKMPAVEVSLPPGGFDDTLYSESGPEAAAAETGQEPPAAGPGPAGEVAPGEVAEGGGSLEDQLRVVDEVVEGLTLEMNSLRQQFEAQNTMVPGSVLQQQMEETNRRLEQAMTRQAGIRAKMERQGIPVKKAAEPGIR